MGKFIDSRESFRVRIKVEVATEEKPAIIARRPVMQRVTVRGKFFYVGDTKYYIKGVTYGTFRPDESGLQYPTPEMVAKDFAIMAASGINNVRTYTVPPQYLLDIAYEHGIRIMAGLPWEQHITFLDTEERKGIIIQRVKEGVKACQNHPAILCYAIGNEIPAGIVRWYGAKAVERFLKRLYEAVKSVDPDALVTYVNFPTTEFLDLPFLDFFCFNVYLETKDKLDRYLQRLHNLAGDQPVVLAEIGLDSMRNGVDKQAEVLDWQLKMIFAKGSAGAFVFAWTDEWWRGGFDIEDWDFGLVDRNRNPKPALKAVSDAFVHIPFPGDGDLPFISVLVCSRNGGATIRDTMEGLMKLDYPSYEVIIVNDGSTDNLVSIVSEYPFRLFSTPNRGLSSARNTGMLLARGEIIVYIDDDAYPDPQWLRYLAYAYTTTTHAGIGGPNIPPDEDGPIAKAVANAPGGPIHVLLTDDIAEHIPGCNMSFRKEALMSVSGFDPIFRTAGDDVDLCWRIQHAGHTIGFHPAAVVWHHRRNSFKSYWRQQKGYGKAEALLENKWPEKYNVFGHVSWGGRIYGNGATRPLKMRKDRIFHGVWGTAPFQSIYQSGEQGAFSFPLMPEWYLLIAVLGGLSVFGIFWHPLLWVIPFFIAAAAIVVMQCFVSSRRAVRLMKITDAAERLKYLYFITLLHMIQPLARLYGRIKHGLTLWRKRGSGCKDAGLLLRQHMELHHWSETWRAPEQWLASLESNLLKSRVRVRRGGNFDRWDLYADCGLFSAAKGLLTIEEHGGGKQMLKFRCWPKYSRIGLIVIAVFSILSIIAVFDNAYIAAALLGISALLLGIKYLNDTARGISEIRKAFGELSLTSHENGSANSTTRFLSLSDPAMQEE